MAVVKDLPNAIREIQRVAGTMSVIKKAPEYPKEHFLVEPFAVSYPEEGEIDTEQIPATKGLHTIITEFHFKTTSLDLTVKAATPLIEEFAKAMMVDPTLQTYIDTIVGPITYKFGRLEWGGEKESHVGIRFRTTIKIRATS